MKRVLIILALSAFATTSAVADRGPRDGDRPSAGDERGPRHGPNPHEIIIDNADEIGLDADQVAAIQALAHARRPEAEAIHEQMRDADASEREALRERMHTIGRGLMEDIFALMTEEQVEAAKELLPPPPGEGRGGEGRRGEGHRGDCEQDDEAR